MSSRQRRDLSFFLLRYVWFKNQAEEALPPDGKNGSVRHQKGGTLKISQMISSMVTRIERVESPVEVSFVWSRKLNKLVL